MNAMHWRQILHAAKTANMKRSLFFFLLSVGFPFLLYGQDIRSDSVLTVPELVEHVMRNHPTAVRAGLRPAQAEAELRSARGLFDPKAYGDWNHKSFDGKNYFRTGDFGLKAQTSIIGAQVKAGYKTASGIFLNPEANLPMEGQAFFGVEVPLVQGMFIDDQRAALRRAEIGQEIGAAERFQVLNDLAYQSILAYVDWAVAYQQREVARDALELIEERLEATRESFFQGANPGIDTLETFIQLQTQQLLLQDAQLALEQAGIQLSYFLWGVQTPGQPPQDLIPDGILDENTPITWTTPERIELGAEHPEILAKQGKLAQLEVDRRLATEMLKPQVNAAYTFLGDGLNFSGFPDSEQPLVNNLLMENFQWEIKASFPLFLRKERGKLEQVRVKALDTEREIDEKRRQIVNKVENYYRQWSLARRQQANYQRIVENYRRLVEAEREKFRLGESSVFLLNSRLQKLVEAQLKAVQLQGKQQKFFYACWWSAGQLHDLLGMEQYVTQ